MNPIRNSSPAIAGLETERGIISNGVNLSAEFNATTGFTEHINTRHYFPVKGRKTLNALPRPSSLSTSIRPW